MTSTAVDPAILRVVGDVGRPERGYDALPDTGHLRGKDGLLAGLANLWGWMRHGHAQLSALEAKAFWHTLLRKACFQFARPFPARHEFKPLGSVPGDVELIVESV